MCKQAPLLAFRASGRFFLNPFQTLGRLHLSGLSVLALLLHVLDTGARAIVVVVELVQCSKIATETQGEALCVRDKVLEACRLFSAAVTMCGPHDRLFSTATLGWKLREARDVVALLVGVPAQ